MRYRAARGSRWHNVKDHVKNEAEGRFISRMSDDSCYHCSRSSELFSVLGKHLIGNMASLNFRARNT